MKYNFFIAILLISEISLGVITFSGLSEDSSIDKNSFLCPKSLDAQGMETCQDRGAQAAGFEFDGPRTLQLFNNQQYWVQQKYKERQLLMARGYKDNDLDSELTSRGWSITGGFLVVITTDSLITDQVEPKLITAKGKVKVVAQLWYNGNNLIQLWAQDVAEVGDGQSFSVFLSSSDSTISKQNVIVEESLKLTNFQEIKKQFLDEIELSPINIIETDYVVAVGSPKNIKIVPAS